MRGHERIEYDGGEGTYTITLKVALNTAPETDDWVIKRLSDALLMGSEGDLPSSARRWRQQAAANVRRYRGQ